MSRLVAALRRRVHGTGTTTDGGFTLVEVLVSFTLFAIVAAGATTGIVSALNGAHGSQQRVEAANVGTQDLSLARTAYTNGSVPLSSTYTSTVGAEQFTVHRTVTFNVEDNGVTPTACTAGASFTVHVEVDQAQNGHFLTQTDTVIAC